MTTAEPAPDTLSDEEPIEHVALSLEEAVDLAIQFLRAGNVATALPILAEAERTKPDDAVIQHFHGIALSQSGQAEDALAKMESSLRIEPAIAGWWNNYGNVLRGCERLDAAIDAYKQALELDPEFPEPYNNLGIVQRARRNLSIAEACFAKAIALNPDYADAYANLGNLLVARGEGLQGVKMLFRAVTLCPHDGTSKRALAYAYGELGEVDKARDIYREWVKDEPDNPIPRHHLAAVEGAAPGRASDDYVRRVFDSFAPNFDTKLDQLGYRAPELANALLREWAPERASGLSIADLGCGTGLCGPDLRARARQLVGVDLSGGMLERARERGCYDELIEQELTAFLNERPAAFDALICADTFCYFGELGAALAASARSLKPGGAIVFTVESLADGDDGIRLAHHGRYAHGRPYVENALREAGLVPSRMLHEILRSESGHDVFGYVLLAEKPA